jgi:hypothetical protein
MRIRSSIDIDFISYIGLPLLIDNGQESTAGASLRTLTPTF